MGEETRRVVVVDEREIVRSVLASRLQRDLDIPVSSAATTTLAIPEGTLVVLVTGEVALPPAAERCLPVDVRVTGLADVAALVQGGQTTTVATPEVVTLTPREREVLQLVAEGLTTSQISQRLEISVSTVAGHRERATGKLGARSSAQAVATAGRLGLLTA